MVILLTMFGQNSLVSAATSGGRPPYSQQGVLLGLAGHANLVALPQGVWRIVDDLVAAG